MAEDRTTMQKPDRSDRNFSLVVPFHLYKNLRAIGVDHNISLGAVCRKFLEEGVEKYKIQRKSPR